MPPPPNMKEVALISPPAVTAEHKVATFSNADSP